jgi:hypothetical protein
MESNVDLYIIGEPNKHLLSYFPQVKIIDKLKLEYPREVKSNFICEDTHCFQHILSQQLKRDSLILTDKIKIGTSKELIETVIKYLNARDDFDICYLTRWGDHCELISSVQAIPNTPYEIAFTQAPNGYDAVYIKAHSKGKLIPLLFKEKELSLSLSHSIIHGNLRALAILPCLFPYDSTKLKTDEYYKTQECQKINLYQPSQLKTISLWWYLLVVLGIIALAYILLQ